MSLEVLEQLESKIQQAVDTIELQKMELEELKQQKQEFESKVTQAEERLQQMQQENERLKQEQGAWQERLRALLGKIENVE